MLYGYDQFLSAEAVRVINSYKPEGLGISEEVYAPIPQTEYENPTFAKSVKREIVKDVEDDSYNLNNDNTIEPESLVFDSWFGEGVAAV